MRGGHWLLGGTESARDLRAPATPPEAAEADLCLAELVRNGS